LILCSASNTLTLKICAHVPFLSGKCLIAHLFNTEILSQLDDDLPTHYKLLDAIKSSKFSKFYNSHVILRTYFFRVRKCDDGTWPYHKPLRDQEAVSAFPDPVPSEIDCVYHYHEGVYPSEKCLPSILDHVEKSALDTPFNPTAQTANNVGFTVRVKNVLNQGWYIWIWNWRDKSHREHKKWRRNCLIYAGAHHRDEEFLAIFFYLKILMTSKIEIPYYVVGYMQSCASIVALMALAPY